MADRHIAAESILAVALGIIIGPVALNWVSPLEWNDGDQEATNYLTWVTGQGFCNAHILT